MTAATQLVSQIRLEQRGFWRNPQAALFTFALPLGLLLVLGATSGDEPAQLVPGVLAFGIIASAYANLAATVATMRAEGVLKRIRATPLPAGLYLAAQVGSALATTTLIAVATLVTARVSFGVQPRSNAVPELLLAFGIGVVCFAALGLAVTRIIPSADAAAPVTVATYPPLVLVSEIFDPTQNLPHWLETAVAWLPIKALADALRAGFDPTAAGLQIFDAFVLAAWAIIGVAVAAKTFRWQP
jgi:ABC-2 type transport system permease protein